MIVYIENEMFWNHIVYAFETILRCIREKKLDFRKPDEWISGHKAIYYGKHVPVSFEGIFIKEGILFGKDYLKKACMPKMPLKRYDDIPVLFMDSMEEIPNIIVKEGYCEFNFDIVQSTFFVVTGCEEIIGSAENFDFCNRYAVESRILFQESFVDRPLVNIYAFILQEFLKRSNMLEQEGDSIAYAVVSHDVDWPYEKMGVKRIIQHIPCAHIKKRMDEGSKIILQTEQKYQIQSTWFFKAGGTNAEFDRYYELQDDEIQRLMRDIIKKGDEIGWHYSYDAAIDGVQLLKEYDYFSKCVSMPKQVGVRGHYLRYRLPYTWRWLSELGVLYDSTCAAAQREGFIWGICTPFQLFDAVEGKNLLVWEIPLIVMDGTVAMPSCRGLGHDQVIAKVEQLVREVKKYNGIFSLLWHNTSLRRKGWYGWENVYVQIMKLLSDQLVCKIGRDALEMYTEM